VKIAMVKVELKTICTADVDISLWLWWWWRLCNKLCVLLEPCLHWRTYSCFQKKQWCIPHCPYSDHLL